MAYNPDGLPSIYHSEIFRDEYAAFNFAYQADLLADESYCQCGGILKIFRDKSVTFGVRVKCNHCGTKKSIFEGTIFNRAKISINKILYLIYCWAQKFSIEQAAFEVQVSIPTVFNYFQAFRDACDEFVYLNQSKIGGPGLTVEIDETQISKRKSQAGRILPNSDIWIFGGICRETKKIFAVQVPDRTIATLTAEIKKFIAPGTKIISDLWPAYGRIPALGMNYTHETVNHSTNFIDPNTGAHTQNVERMWRDLKFVKKKYNGFHREEIDSHLAEFLWRKNKKVNIKNCFRKALELIANTIFEPVE